MARIDSYLRNLERFGAHGMVLKSGNHVMMRFSNGERFATQSTPHQNLVDLIKEILPAKQQGALETGQEVRFAYSLDGHEFTVAIQPKKSEWTVSIDAAAAEPAPNSVVPLARIQPVKMPSAPEPVVEVPPEEEPLPIERTQYQPSPKADSAGSATPAASPAMPAGEGVLDRLLIAMKKAGASDLHLSTGCRPMVRASGEVMALEDFAVLEADTLLRDLYAITPQKNQLEFKERSDTDYAYTLPGVSRFRANLFRDHKGPGAVFRAIPFQMPNSKQLGIPEKVLELCYLSTGLVVVTGPTGSGKSTTLAALIDHVNENRSDHLITIEDPIEFIHPNKKCLINQREVHSHTRSFKDALRAALREDPDIVLVGEMRDLETIAIAVETAETGHLVFGTLHTTTAPGTVDRIIDQFPADRQEQIRAMLSESLMGVIAQVLCRKKGGGRVAAYEILLGTPAVANLIREHKTFQLFSVMQTNRNLGMRTMNDSLIDLVRNGVVEPKEAYIKAVNKSEFKNLLTKEGVDLSTLQ